ncbi:D-alanyl-D-alanine carboxypeptidase/D-alanyl-D-alanine endopeptidase [Pseudosporangium ferrugineum]|uniref:D-alanyl-D-alanine carboxypeptidase/D-alanyl-D-alanine-endopeptidase (Penicillin-binding protein 4) n=1 Tax=Pseudosporangium ferrugineum TaxID=439699 RepID=A0A2T0SIF1_9ACTN|nr:D-alanyl-D-alanine carboxypeptidase/D-alanyl-D-alanine-endopeptidase [Pseudosporangium ferrugineum]PRY33157.1 D-alanyl-D-alanine carboxypeptidase/D-alanyl-D-alanine-endopeptidase (penicillin-binding protein 4) [Pseudosporangium ferrugineum]
MRKVLKLPLVPGLAVVAVAVTGTALAVGTASAETGGASDTALVATLDQVLANSRLAGSTTGLQVRDATSGAVIYSHNAEQRVIPASNEKLMTSAAALEVLGTGYKFHTYARYSGTKSGKTVSGNLYLKGQGDPTLTYAQFDAIATAVNRAGITKFTGSLVADDTWFDRTPLGLDWSWQDETYADTAPISALTVAADGNFNSGAVAVVTKPGSAANKAGAVTLTPANSVLKVVNNTVTGASGSANTVSATRAHGTNTITVSGSVPLGGAAKTSLVSVLSPTQVAAGVFRDALKRHGVTVVGATTTGATPSSAKTITDHASIPLSQLLPYFLKLPNNGHAELLTKAMGRARTPGSAGSWSTGLAASTAALKAIGVDTGKITMGDGSGLSRRDWLTTAQIATLLQAAQSRPWFATWYAALPIAGNPAPLVGGTLASRMKGTPAENNLHGKTGTLTGVNALSGYVTDRSGRKLLFSSISNAAQSNVADLLDTAAVAIASTGGPQAASRRTAELPTVPRHVVKRNGEDVECSWVPNAC